MRNEITNKPDVLGGNGNGSKPKRTERGDMKNFYKREACPYRVADLPHPCENIPGYYYCGSLDCYRLGVKAVKIDLAKLNQEERQQFVKAVTLVEPEVIDQLLEAQTNQHNRTKVQAPTP